ncbi:hypothetical protein Q7P36_009762 [Cladosporium allicinum]
MEDKVITIVFGSLGATLALVSVLFAYLQLRGFRPAIAPDEEQAVALAAVAREEPITGRRTLNWLMQSAAEKCDYDSNDHAELFTGLDRVGKEGGEIE